MWKRFDNLVITSAYTHLTKMKQWAACVYSLPQPTQQLIDPKKRRVLFYISICAPRPKIASIDIFNWARNPDRSNWPNNKSKSVTSASPSSKMHRSRQWNERVSGFFLLLSSVYVFYFSPAGMFLFQGEVRRRQRRGVSLGSAWGGAASGGGVAVSASVGAFFKAIPKHTHEHTETLISQKATRIFRQHARRITTIEPTTLTARPQIQLSNQLKQPWEKCRRGNQPNASRDATWISLIWRATV